jgi:hypothetical protein
MPEISPARKCGESSPFCGESFQDGILSMLLFRMGGTGVSPVQAGALDKRQPIPQ